MNRIDAMFQSRRAEGKRALIFYLTAGYPDFETSEKAVAALVEGGMDLLELGIPFSDPIADGPTIQAASTVALENGASIAGIFDLLERLRKNHPALSILLFTAYNPVYHYKGGEAAFLDEAARRGADGILIPDLPPEAAKGLGEAAGRLDLSTVFLAAPTTTPERAKAVAEASTGFIYYISLKGVTGARATLPADLSDRVRALKAVTDKPVGVGFGVAAPEQARAVAEVADGVIVGSALIKLVAETAGKPELAERVREYAQSLRVAVDAVAGA